MLIRPSFFTFVYQIELHYVEHAPGINSGYLEPDIRHIEAFTKLLLMVVFRCALSEYDIGMAISRTCEKPYCLANYSDSAILMVVFRCALHYILGEPKWQLNIKTIMKF